MKEVMNELTNSIYQKNLDLVSNGSLSEFISHDY